MFDLKEKILGENKALVRSLEQGDDFSAICRIREWVYKIANITEKRLLNVMPNMADINAIGVRQATQLYERHMLGTLCGGTNIFLSKIYQLFGYQSTTYNFGIEETGFTHEICVVRTEHEDTLFLQDAYFNGYYAFGGKPVNFLEAENILENGRSIHFVKGRNRTKYRLKAPEPALGTDSLLQTERIEFGWDEAIKWFQKKNKGQGFSGLFDLMRLPLNYAPIGIDTERPLLTYLNALSVRFQTRYHKIRSDKLYRANNLDSIRVSLPKKIYGKEKIILYGICGYGIQLYDALKSHGIRIRAIVDGDLDLAGTIFSGHVIHSPEELTMIDHDLIIVCSISHEQEIVSKIHELLGVDVCIVTLGKMLQDV